MDIRINDGTRITIYDKQTLSAKKQDWREKNKEAYKTDETRWECEDSEEGLIYQALSLLRLRKNRYYIQIDNRPTYWYAVDYLDKESCHFNGYIIHYKVTSVIVEGDILTVHYHNKVQEYRRNKNTGGYDRFNKKLAKHRENISSMIQMILKIKMAQKIPL